MTAQFLLTLSAISKAANQFGFFLESASNELYSLQKDVNKLDINEDETALEAVADTLGRAGENVQEACENLDILIMSIIGGASFPTKDDFFQSLSLKDQAFLDHYWGVLYIPELPLFSSDWMKFGMPVALNNLADQTRVHNIYEQGLSWFEARLHTASHK